MACTSFSVTEAVLLDQCVSFSFGDNRIKHFQNVKKVSSCASVLQTRHLCRCTGQMMMTTPETDRVYSTVEESISSADLISAVV